MIAGSEFLSGILVGIVGVSILAFIARTYRDFRVEMRRPFSPQSVVHLTGRSPWQVLLSALTACGSCMVFTSVLGGMVLLAIWLGFFGSFWP